MMLNKFVEVLGPEQMVCRSCTPEDDKYFTCVFPRETVSFVLPTVPMFPETKSTGTSGLEEKQN